MTIAAHNQISHHSASIVLPQNPGRGTQISYHNQANYSKKHIRWYLHFQPKEYAQHIERN